ncbi:MAG: DUF5685 family protein [Clostridia bacterium]|nr:DUF5685 family protein [Clostridia bacterium]
MVHNLFGYVKVYKPELKIKHYEAYKGVYCSVCAALGRDYGLFARMTLSYDVTMLALTRLCASGEKLCFKNGRCPFNPGKRCNFCKNNTAEFSYAAAVGVLLTYYKLKDNIHDDGFFGKLAALLILPFIIRAAKKAARHYPYVSDMISNAMENQKRVECSAAASTDEAADPVASLLAELFSLGFSDKRKAVLSRLGYCVGRFIYTADACEDIEKDIKKNSYNVFTAAGGITAEDSEKIKSGREKAKKSLLCCAGEAAKCFELLEKNALTPICENIIYDGLYNTAQTVTDNKKNRKEKTDEKSL